MTPEERERHNARRRAKKKAARADVSTEIAIIYQKPLDEWDDEEIARGRPRAQDGTFRGKAPSSYLTPALQAERQRRLRQLMADELGTFAADALRTIHAVMVDPATGDKDRLTAATYLVDQFMGKATAKLELAAHNPLEDLLGDILVNPDGEPSHMIIEGGVIDQVEDEDPLDLQQLD